ncbi:hypothetical protein [Tepidibacter formicigenes]|jgi:protoheme ferro-lyase|uniref:Ferrochelatase n=1 Tax=Tepidibacter formicigenes DSM 15518 TaxID=1123349 RepID=A0A1M6KAR5_9FIRM|nr:hypothetical protein [Tepidibacter formicigenes]SHJ56022.1 hypothetical protein SAMN02744037_00308 [Tepidibacter formicigenes DSM 15518]
MYKKIILGLCFFSMFIFNNFLENIFIIAFVIGMYNLFLNKDFKNLFIGFILAHFILNFLVIVFFQDRLELKELESTDKRENKTAVVLVYDGEDKKYNLKQRAREIYQRNRLYSFLNMNYKLYKYKNMYQDLGSSQFKNKSYITRNSLSERLGKNYIVVNSNLYTTPYIEEILIDLVNKGYKDIILCPIFFTEGKDYDLLRKRINNMGILKYEINIKLTDLFWNSQVLAKVYKNKILESIDNKDKTIGVLLVGLEEKNNLEEDIIFREKIKKYLKDEKIYDIKIKLPLLENHKKDIIKTGDELLEYGIDSLCLVIPTSLFETVYIRTLAEHILEKLDIPNETRFHYIGPFNEDEVFIDELYKKIKLAENEGGN